MRTCPSCGSESPKGFAFCGRCGAPLGSLAPTEERKVVTVLFCDLAGFTARSDGADPEDVRARLRPYHVCLRRETERFGGMVDKFIGDGVMAVFGIPSHEDDPERAVRCALAMAEAVQELNREQPDLDLAVRIGLTTGEAVVTLGGSRETEGVVGDVVNTAARLEGVAPIGGVVVGEPTWAATSKLFDYEPLPHVRVKGKSEPLAIWRAVSARSRLGVGVDVKAATPFVDRDLELVLLQGIYGRATREASAQLVTIVGEPGVGKTRLIRELREFVDARPELVSWRQGRCLPYGEGVTFSALGEVVKAQAGILESDDAQAAAGKLADAVAVVAGEHSEREWLKARLAPLVGLATADEARAAEREEVFAAWRRFLELVAEAGPLVVVLEDLHWADEAFLAFTRHLIDWASGVALLVIAAARPELYDRAPDWAGGLPNATTISLRPLSDADTARLVAALLDRAVLPADTQAALLERASGNPLYAEEVCRTLVEQGEFELDHLGSIQALIAARLDRLTVEHKQLLQDAAVIGKVFWAGALTSMGDRDAATVRAGLHDLQRRELVRPTRSSTMKDDTEYAFWHGLTRDVAYGQLPRAARATKHRAAAAWLERAAGNRIADQAEVLAHHYDQALTNARAARLPGQAAELEGASLRFLMLAGDRALALDVARADDYYQRALRLAPAGHPERAAILAKAAEVAKHAGRMTEAEQTYEDAIAAFRVRGDLVGAGGAMVRSAVVLWLRGEPARSRELLASAIELLEGGPPGPELAAAYEQMAADVLTHGRPAEALVWVAKAIDLADRVGAEDTRQLALQFRGGARFMGGDVGGMDDLREAVQLGLRLGLGPATALAYYNFADAVFMLDGPAAALETYRAGRVLCRQRGITELGVALEEGILRCLAELGSWDDAMPIADKLITWYQARGGHYFDVAIQSMKADILVHRGRVAEALPLTERFLPRAREIGDLQVVVQALPVAALVAQADGQLDAAIRLVEEFERVTREGPGPYRAEPLPRLLRVCGDAGELSLAERLLEVEAHTIRHQHCLVAARAVLAEAHGDLEQASSWYAEAVERWSGYGALLEHGQALLGLGRCQVGLGRPAARDRLMQASAIFGRLAARPLLAAADGWLRRAHQKRRPT